LITQVSALYHEVHPTLTVQIAIADTTRAFLAGELGDRARAAADYAAAITTTASATDPDIVVMHDLMLGEDAIVRGDADAAVAPLGRVSDRRLASERWYEHEEGLRAEVGLGVAAAMRGRDSDAIRHLVIAVADYPAIIGKNEEVKYKRVYARAEHALAAALRRTGSLARAEALERDAMAFYSAAGAESYRWVLEPGASP
jgi:hypothetical protein